MVHVWPGSSAGNSAVIDQLRLRPFAPSECVRALAIATINSGSTWPTSWPIAYTSDAAGGRAIRRRVRTSLRETTCLRELRCLSVKAGCRFTAVRRPRADSSRSSEGDSGHDLRQLGLALQPPTLRGRHYELEHHQLSGGGRERALGPAVRCRTCGEDTLDGVCGPKMIPVLDGQAVEGQQRW
jgi:hypothetical protein